MKEIKMKQITDDELFEILSGIIDAIQQVQENYEIEKQRREPLGARWVVNISWKRDFLEGLKISPEIKKRLGEKL